MKYRSRENIQTSTSAKRTRVRSASLLVPCAIPHHRCIWKLNEHLKSEMNVISLEVQNHPQWSMRNRWDTPIESIFMPWTNVCFFHFLTVLEHFKEHGIICNSSDNRSGAVLWSTIALKLLRNDGSVLVLWNVRPLTTHWLHGVLLDRSFTTCQWFPKQFAKPANFSMVPCCIHSNLIKGSMLNYGYKKSHVCHKGIFQLYLRNYWHKNNVKMIACCNDCNNHYNMF